MSDVWKASCRNEEREKIRVFFQTFHNMVKLLIWHYQRNKINYQRKNFSSVRIGSNPRFLEPEVKRFPDEDGNRT